MKMKIYKIILEYSPTVYKDIETPSPFIEQFSNDDGCAARNARPDHIYMDCMGFGMGCSCLQVTFQACDIDEARHLYDQLACVCPVMVRRTRIIIICSISCLKYTFLAGSFSVFSYVSWVLGGH